DSCTTPASVHVPIGGAYRLDPELPELLERAQALTIQRRGPGDSVLARLETVPAAERTNVARALSRKGFLEKADKGTGPPKNAHWHLIWHTQGRIVEVFDSETKHAVVVRDETRRWSGSNTQADL